MKLPIVLMVVMILLGSMGVGSASAETMYVTDVLRLKLRSEPNDGGEVEQVILSGQALEVVSETDTWARVRLPDGAEGWVPIRYLTADRTARLKLDRLEGRFDSQKTELAALRSENIQLKRENSRLQTELSQKSRQAEEARKAYDALKEESTDYLQLKSEHQRTLKKASEQSTQVLGLEKELTRLETQRLVRWFLAGAGVLLLGIVIGFSAKRQRRKYLT